MKEKYMNTQIRQACLSRPLTTGKDIHAQLAETIAGRRRIMQQLEIISGAAKVIDVYLGNTKVA